ncbi:MAG: DUF3738 domain-containing protein [Janthinobacterium lividum]
MKQLLTCLLTLLSLSTAYAQARLGDVVPDLRFATVLNGAKASLSLRELRGQVVLLEFWGTYCGPCVAAMPHLQDLQRQFAGRLQVVTISQEAPARLTRYLQTRPSNLLFAAVTSTAGDSLQQLFACRTVPHSVLLDETGHLLATTEPQNITAATVEQVLRHQAVTLPLKQDQAVANPLAVYFPATAATPPRCLIQPAIAGVGSMLRQYPQDTSVFHNRRLSALNVSVEELYQLAYGNVPFDRMLDLRPVATRPTKRPRYCLDLLVARGQEATLLATLREELATRFGLDVHATLESRVRPVYLLEVADAAQLPPVSAATAGRSTSVSAGVYEGSQVSLADFAEYLERFGVVSLPVLTTTPSTARYAIHFEYQAEKANDHLRALSALGLRLQPAERPVTMLVIR